MYLLLLQDFNSVAGSPAQAGFLLGLVTGAIVWIRRRHRA